MLSMNSIRLMSELHNITAVWYKLHDRPYSRHFKLMLFWLKKQFIVPTIYLKKKYDSSNVNYWNLEYFTKLKKDILADL